MDPECQLCCFPKSYHTHYSQHRFIEKPAKPSHLKRRALLKAWKLIEGSTYDLHYRLRGAVYGHDRFADGTVIETSPVLRVDFPQHTAETLNTVYLLK